MQALSKLSSYVCNKSFVMFPTAMNSLSVGVFSCKRIAPQLPPLWRDSPSSDWTTKSSFIRRSANFGNVSPFSSSRWSNKHIFRAYPSTLKIAELCFETKAANSIIIWSARLGFLPLREAGTGFVGVPPLPSTHVWSSRKHYTVPQGAHTICLRSRLLFYSKCTGFTVCFRVSGRFSL